MNKQQHINSALFPTTRDQQANNVSNLTSLPSEPEENEEQSSLDLSDYEGSRYEDYALENSSNAIMHFGNTPNPKDTIQQAITNKNNIISRNNTENSLTVNVDQASSLIENSSSSLTKSPSSSERRNNSDLRIPSLDISNLNTSSSIDSEIAEIQEQHQDASDPLEVYIKEENFEGLSKAIEKLLAVGEHTLVNNTETLHDQKKENINSLLHGRNNCHKDDPKKLLEEETTNPTNESSPTMTYSLTIKTSVNDENYADSSATDTSSSLDMKIPSVSSSTKIPLSKNANNSLSESQSEEKLKELLQHIEMSPSTTHMDGPNHSLSNEKDETLFHHDPRTIEKHSDDEMRNDIVKIMNTTPSNSLQPPKDIIPHPQVDVHALIEHYEHLQEEIEKIGIEESAHSHTEPLDDQIPSHQSQADNLFRDDNSAQYNAILLVDKSKTDMLKHHKEHDLRMDKNQPLSEDNLNEISRISTTADDYHVSTIFDEKLVGSLIEEKLQPVSDLLRSTGYAGFIGETDIVQSR